MPELMRKKPTQDESFDSVVVVDRIPQVGPDRLEKLKIVLQKIFGKYKMVDEPYYPLDEKQHTKGYII